MHGKKHLHTQLSLSLSSQPNPHPETKGKKKSRKEALSGQIFGVRTGKHPELCFPSSYLIFSFVRRESDHVVEYPDNCLILYVSLMVIDDLELGVLIGKRRRRRKVKNTHISREAEMGCLRSRKPKFYEYKGSPF